jgi:SAM-dependent methyltransferase
MQAYGKAFAQAYNLRWASFAQKLAPKIDNLYQNSAADKMNRNILDLCCGTGVLVSHFLSSGYTATGLDLSEYMIEYARRNNIEYVQSGKAKFVIGDASHFTFDEEFGLVTCTYDAINHFTDYSMLESCFQSVKSVLSPGGLFIFDINTRKGLSRWSGVHTDSSDEIFILEKGIYEAGMDRAYTQMSGFVRVEGSELYSRFEETVYNTVFDTGKVQKMLFDLGWSKCYFATFENLEIAIDNPEEQGRVFFVAEK